ncbi:hypothetical protein BGZ49_007907 [Haplosporangium sp. Z 27]|nr:hypothetical protein BGZ49_007907 [Haplosporangium sp. Z 27]
MSEKEEIKGDIERKGSFTSTLSNPEEDKLRALAEQNPYYDHDLTWTAEEEKQLVRIFDLKILSWVGVMFFFLQLDRGNLSNALTVNNIP